jgi:hypothetical protein
MAGINKHFITHVRHVRAKQHFYIDCLNKKHCSSTFGITDLIQLNDIVFILMDKTLFTSGIYLI